MASSSKQHLFEEVDVEEDDIVDLTWVSKSPVMPSIISTASATDVVILLYLCTFEAKGEERLPTLFDLLFLFWIFFFRSGGDKSEVVVAPEAAIAACLAFLCLIPHALQRDCNKTNQNKS